MKSVFQSLLFVAVFAIIAPPQVDAGCCGSSFGVSHAVVRVAGPVRRIRWRRWQAAAPQASDSCGCNCSSCNCGK